MNGQTDMSALHEQASICHYGRAITPFIFLTFWYFCFFVFVLLGVGWGQFTFLQCFLLRPIKGRERRVAHRGPS